MQPEFEDEEAINPFDFWEGANFKLKAKNVAGYRNYDSSEFDRVKPLNDDDEVLEGLWKQEYSLAELVAADQFKDYETLKKRLNVVLGLGAPSRRPAQEDTEEDNVEEQLRSARPAFQKEESSYSEPADFNSPDITPSVSAEEDDSLAYFQSLAD